MSDRLATLVFAVIALLLLVLMAAQAQRTEATAGVGHSLRAGARPVWDGTLGVARGLQRIWENHLYVSGLRRERDRLLERVNQLEVERRRTEELRLENSRLRRLLDLNEEPAFSRGVVARVVADLSSGPLRRAVLVDRGARDGVERDWLALSRGALVGRVRDAQRRWAEVLLIVDADSGVAVRHQLDRFAGVLRGGVRGPLILARLEYVPRDQAVAVGDAVVTSGLDGVHPPGLLVGYVRDIAGDSPLTWRITVAPAADMSRLEDVLLVPPQRRPEAR